MSCSPGARISGPRSAIATSAACTTTGAVAVSVPLDIWIVPCPEASATMLPFWSTLAMSSRKDFQTTRTGAAGEPSSRRARGEAWVFSDGNR